MSRSEAGLLDAYAGLIRLVLFALYALYIVLGVILIIVGLTMGARGLTGNVALYIILSGISMIIIGAACLVITYFKWWLAMIILQIVNFALFVFLITTGLIGVFVGGGYADPVGDAFDEFFDDVRVADGVAEDLGLCYTLAEENDLDRLGKGDDWRYCRTAYLLANPDCGITEIEDMINTQAEFAVNLWTDLLVYYGNCSSLEVHMASENEGSWATTTTDNGDVTQTFTATNSVPSAFYNYEPLEDCQTTFVASQLACDACNLECKENAITITKKNMTPVALAMLCFSFFFVFTATVNNHITDYAAPSEADDDDDGEKDNWASVVPFHAKILCYIFDGITTLFGLILVIAGITAYSAVQSEDGCPMKKVGKDCPDEVFIVLIFVGLGVMASGFIVLAAVFLSKRTWVMLANLVFIAMCLVLLIITIMLGLATGVLATSVTQIDNQYIESRNEIRKVCDEDECTLFCAEECTDDELCANQPYDNPCDGWEGITKPVGGFDDGAAQVTQITATSNRCQDCDTFNTPVKCLPQYLCSSDYDDYVDDYLLQFHSFYWGSETESYTGLDDAAFAQIFPDETCVFNADFQYEQSAPDQADTATQRRRIDDTPVVYECTDYADNDWCASDGSEGSGWDSSTMGNYADQTGFTLTENGLEASTPWDACCACGAQHCGCPENDPNYVELDMKDVFDVSDGCSWMTVCQYDCEICASDDDAIDVVSCHEVLATDPNVNCGASYEESKENIETCSMQGGLIYTNAAGGQPAPNGEYCDDSCSICGYGEIQDAEGGTGEYYTSAEDCIRCADSAMKLNVDLTEDFGTGTCEEDSWDYQADLPVPEVCECTYRWTGCKKYDGPKDGYKDMSADDCKAEVRGKVEDYMSTVGTVAIVVCCIFIGIMFLTAIAIDQWRDEEDDEVEVETKTYVDGKLVESKKKTSNK